MKNKRMILISIGLLIITLLSLSYAFIRGGIVSGNSTLDNLLITSEYNGEAEVTVRYDQHHGSLNSSFTLNRSDVGTDKINYIKFSIENELNRVNYISVFFDDVVNTFCEYRDADFNCSDDETLTYTGDELMYVMYECSDGAFADVGESNLDTTCTKISPNYNEIAPKTGESFALHAEPKIVLQPNESKYYVVAMVMKNLETVQDYQLGAVFSSNIVVKSFESWSGEDCSTNPNKLACKIVATYEPWPDDRKSLFVTSETGIDFSQISSDTNGKGLYEDVKIGVNGMIKYFRGNVNNYVTFAGYTWRVVKINEDSSVKIIALNSGLTSKIFGSSTSGYTNTRSGNNIGLENNVKTELDKWYFNNLRYYDHYIESDLFCNDTSNTTSTHGPNVRMVTNKLPTYNCPTTSQTYGGTYYLKIGLLSIDEASYAGGVYGVANATYFLNDATVYWTFSPNTSNQVWYVHSNGSLNAAGVTNTYVIRPVINLKNFVTASGSGTSVDPWVINAIPSREI